MTTPGDGPRFSFGGNWRDFARHVDDARIATAEATLARVLGRADLRGASFLDVGCGSGLMSLAARRLGARARSFDLDPDSVRCAEDLRARYRPDDADWTIERGSILDEPYVRSLGQHDVVYSWGVLHHTGALWRALELVALPVAPRGLLHLAIYNDQGAASHWWRRKKRLYNALPRPLRAPYVVACMLPDEVRIATEALRRGGLSEYARVWTGYGQERGMSRWHDMVDWVGGYPFEFAEPGAVFEFFRARGFRLENLVTRSATWGCNEYVFQRA